MLIACDFDSTLMNPQNRLPGYRMGQPVKGAILATQRLAEEGHQIVIFTARSVNKPEVYKAVKDWLDYFHIPYHGITNVKRPEFEVYIDDRALRFNGDWTQTLSQLHEIDNNLKVREHKAPDTQLINDITQPLN